MRPFSDCLLTAAFLFLCCSVAADEQHNGFQDKWLWAAPGSEAGIRAALNHVLRSQQANLFQSAGGGNRTHTLLRELDFESSASANSATPAKTFTLENKT